MVVAESTLNVACAGARPVALVNCLNFGNPEHAEVMWQLSEAIDGMSDACRALGVPVIGGNVSLYNESRGRDIDPTPVVGVLGLIDDLSRRPPGLALVDGGELVLLGRPGPLGLGGSRWAAEVHGHRGGVLPELDLGAHAALLEMARTLAEEGAVAAVHDVADGGLAACLAEMALAGQVGFVVVRNAVADHDALFSEAPSRVVLCVDPGRADAVVARSMSADVPATVIGRAGGDRMIVEDLLDVGLDEATRRWRDAIPSALGAPAASS